MALDANPSAPDAKRCCDSYNGAAGTRVAVLVGNWSEERAMLVCTGASRRGGAGQTAARVAAGDGPAAPSPAAWRAESAAAFAPPATAAAAAGPGSSAGPRESRELAALLARAASEAAAAAAGAAERRRALHAGGRFVTTHAERFAGLAPEPGTRVGARVTRDPDGRPARRDPTFLAEAGIMPRARADRLAGGCLWSVPAPAPPLPPGAPVTIHSEAASAAGRAAAAAHRRRDDFTKLNGDVRRRDG